MQDNKAVFKLSSIDEINKVYFLGIGGVSMSSLALILKSKGKCVSGYDLYHSKNTELLEQRGIRINYEHNIDALAGVDTVVYTAAIPENCEEIKYAKNNNIRVITRAELLGLITSSYKYSVGVSGTHGKSTTTAMISDIFCAYDPESSCLGGAVMPKIGSSFKIGNSDRVVFEACEYKDSFLSMRPSLKVVLNCKLDHVDYFPDLEAIKKSFHTYMDTARSDERGDNIALVNADCENAVDASRGVSAKVYYYSASKKCDFWAGNVDISDGFARFDLYCGDELKVAGIKLKVPGLHNLSNAVAAAGAALLTGADKKAVYEGLSSFSGVSRRFEYKGTLDTDERIDFYDDYAHHPDEIEVTLNSAKMLCYKRVICVFQPHTYSRTYSLLDGFAKALSLCDKVFLTDIYPARETNIYNISSKDLADKIPGCEYYDSFDKVRDALLSYIKDGDLVLTMGAGEAYRITEEILK